MRLFVAVPLPPDVASAAALALPDIPALRRVRADLMHVTLAFLGAVPDERLDEVASAVTAAAAGARPFTISLDGVGRFPAGGVPRVVWLGIVQGATEITDLAASVRRALAAHRVTHDEKPFRAHVTLGRVRENADRESARAIAAAADRVRIPAMRFTATDVVVFESTLSSNGPRYTARATVPLGVGGKS